ncbi:hypothetical protein [Psychromonas aquimarina]|uniref:hypothetical protein n=1 Tax=Psychromonas aquimarina TaxID=444919 RepID=UPI00040AA52E|nr:hypothetical protein [Psychromonas aquimarina]
MPQHQHTAQYITEQLLTALQPYAQKLISKPANGERQKRQLLRAVLNTLPPFTLDEQETALLELGVGFNTPAITRFPFEQFSSQFPHTHLIRLNKDDARSQDKIKANNLLVGDDICQWLNKLADI